MLVEQLREDGPRAPARVRTQLTLAGLDVTPGALLLHDGTRAEVYCLTPDNELELQTQFEGTGAAKQGRGAMAIRGESVYRTGQDCIEVCNMAGRAAVSLSCPLMLSCVSYTAVVKCIWHEVTSVEGRHNSFN